MTDPNDEFVWPGRKHRPFKSKPPVRQPNNEPKTRQPPSDVDDLFAHVQEQMWDNQFRDGWFWGGENLARDLIQQEALQHADPNRQFHGVYLPMLFCYRHYLEVSLKHLIEILIPLSELEVKPDIHREHGLMQLWNEAKRLMAETFRCTAEADANTNKNVERLINEFHQFDPNSQTFRYRRDKQGRPQEDSIPTTDLGQLIEVMHGLRNYFEASDDYAEEVAGWQAEMQAEIPNEGGC